MWNLVFRPAVMPRMKRILAVLATVALALPAFAGLSYDFKTVSSGMTAQTIAGSVRAEGPNMRVDFTSGDGMLFTNGSYALTSGGSVIKVIDPAAKTYYDINLDQLFGGADGLLRQMGGEVKLEVKNPKSSVTADGSGGTIAGYPAQKSRIDTSYDMSVDALGQAMVVQMQMSTDVWWTEKLGSEFTNFLQMRGLRTGVEAVDKVLAVQTSAVKGFPLKQVITTKVVLNGNPITTTTTSEVSNIRPGKIDAAAFAVPAGLTKVPNPIETMLNR
jgi:hypothetical protein